MELIVGGPVKATRWLLKLFGDNKSGQLAKYSGILRDAVRSNGINTVTPRVYQPEFPTGPKY